MKKEAILLILYLCILRSGMSAQTPGGVTMTMGLWVKADAGTSTTVNNAPVATWNDYSGNSRNSAQGTSSQQPLFQNGLPGTINFNPTLKFDGIDDYLLVGGSNGATSDGNNNYTFYAVIKPKGTTNTTKPGKFFTSGDCASHNSILSFDIRDPSYKVNDTWNWNDAIYSGAYTSDYPVLFSFLYDGTSPKSRKVRINGTLVLTYNTVTARTSTSTTLNTGIGAGNASGCGGEEFDGYIAELISVKLGNTLTEIQRIQTYLALKYGITLSHNYLNSASVVVWNISSFSSAYNNNIIGLARDDNSSLLQKQSKSEMITSDILTLFMGNSLGSYNPSSTSTFVAGDLSFFITGRNNVPVLNTVFPHPDRPAGIATRLQREWAVQKTNFTNTNLSMKFDLTGLPTGTILANDLRLMLDDDGIFGSGAMLYGNATSPSVSISVTGQVITITGIDASWFTSKPYFTLGSVASTTPLPVELVSFDVSCDQHTLWAKWVTASESNNQYFSIENSSNAIDWTEIATNNGAGISNISLVYQVELNRKLVSGNYFRLKQVDLDGNYTVYDPIYVQDLCNSPDPVIYPNPNEGTLYIQDDHVKDLHLYNMLGQEMAVILVKEPNGIMKAHIEGLAPGVYVLHLEDTFGKVWVKSIVKK